jgi:hypothetical protein
MKVKLVVDKKSTPCGGAFRNLINVSPTAAIHTYVLIHEITRSLTYILS